MKLSVQKSSLSGEMRVPASKSHTIRAVVISSLADGESEIIHPLESWDTQAAVDVCRAFGADIVKGADTWKVLGTGGHLQAPSDVVNVCNSGTTLYITLSTAALCNGYSVFTGDDQIRQRPTQPLIDALNDLGATAFSTRGNGLAPIVVKGRMKGGKTEVLGVTSQYVSSLLMNCPLAENTSEFSVRELNERPYVQMTLDWLDRQGIVYKQENFERFEIPGGQSYRAFREAVPGDFSSATFFLCAAAITGADITLHGLDMKDSQGDKDVVGMLDEMGAEVEIADDYIRIKGGKLEGREFDMNAIPDALPAMAVVGCFAEGTTKLMNVPQARVKETDRISVMCAELTKMGGRVEELSDGLVITGHPLHGADVHGHADHRVVMALAIAGMGVEGATTIDTAEAISVTFPNFVELMKGLGANITAETDTE